MKTIFDNERYLLLPLLTDIIFLFVQFRISLNESQLNLKYHSHTYIQTEKNGTITTVLKSRSPQKSISLNAKTIL